MPRNPLLRGLGEVLGEIPLESIKPRDGLETRKLDVTTLASYNLLPKQQKTMIVPGSPSIWSPPDTPRAIKPDAGIYVRDPARHNFPRCSLEPLFRALCVVQPGLKMDSTELVTDRRNLRLLLGFVGGRKSSFRIDMENVNGTVLFSCWTPKTMDYVNNFQGYGHEFERMSTRRPRAVGNSITHHRIMRYVFGNIKIILRHEVDGCTGNQDDIHKRLPMFGSDTTPTECTVIRRGNLIAASRILEIKTGPTGKSLDISKDLEQLWFSQTPILCTGLYDKSGRLTQITEENVLQNGKLQEWEERHHEKLKNLAALLRIIVDLAQSATWRKCALISSEGSLKIFSLINQNGGLPIDLHAMWDHSSTTTKQSSGVDEAFPWHERMGWK